jgi:hypothetical protein
MPWLISRIVTLLKKKVMLFSSSLVSAGYENNSSSVINEMNSSFPSRELKTFSEPRIERTTFVSSSSLLPLIS